MVASCVEAWIEIYSWICCSISASVASCVEAWIEIGGSKLSIVPELSRLLRGGVD